MWTKSPPTTQNSKIRKSAKKLSECTSTKWNRKKPFLSTDNTSRWHNGKIEIIIALQWIRVRGGQCLSFGPQTTSPRSAGSARCSLRPRGRTSTRQDSSASSQSSRRPENRHSVFSTESIGKAQTSFILNKHELNNSATIKVDYQRWVAAQQHTVYLLSFNINIPKSSLEQGPSKVTAGRMTSNVNEWEGLTGERTLGEGQQLHSVAEILQQVSRLEQWNSPLPSHATSSSSSFTDCSTSIWGMVLRWW